MENINELQKIYILIENWVDFDSGENGTETTIFKTKQQVLEALETRQNEILEDYKQYDTTEKTKNGYTNYISNSYLEFHTDIWYEEKKITEE